MITDEQVKIALNEFGSAEWSVGSLRAMKAALTAYEQSKWQEPELAPVGERRLIEASDLEGGRTYYFIAAKEDTGDWQHDNGYYVSQDAQYVIWQQPLPVGDSK